MLPPLPPQPLPSPPTTPRSFLPQLPAPPLPEPEPLVASESDDELKSVKRQKLDEEDSESSESDSSEDVCEELDSSYSDSSEDVCEELDLDRPYRPVFPGQKLQGREIWKSYYHSIQESEGFDIKDFPGLTVMTTVIPMPYYVTDPDPEDAEKMKGFAAQALELYNQKNSTTYEVNEILKVNGRVILHRTFCITLSVKNGEHEYFQVKVVEHRDGSLDFPIVRPRVKGGLDI